MLVVDDNMRESLSADVEADILSILKLFESAVESLVTGWVIPVLDRCSLGSLYHGVKKGW